MSHENVEIAKRGIDAFNATDVDEFTALTTPDFQWSPSMVAIEGEVFRGGEGIRAYFASLSNAWEEFVILPDRFRDLADLVIMLGRLRGRGKNSGVPVDASLGMVFDFRDGKIARIRGYLDHGETLRAAGVSEQATSQESLERVQAAFDAYFRGDEPAMLELVASDVVVTQFPDQADVRDYHGHVGLAQVMTEWIGTWDDWSIEILGAKEVGDLVLATARQRGRGKGSGAPMEAEVTFVFTVRQGKIARWQMFRSEREALEAVEPPGD
jgi:ketosteroid isomerase-like protein